MSHNLVIIYIFISLSFFSSHSMNVGTVLFTKMDLYRPCWSSEEMALLASRMVFEDLLPTPDVIRMDSDELVEDLMCYFREVIQMIRDCTDGRNKHLALLALTDLLGGYLQNVILPYAKYAYYSGTITFKSVYKVKQLFEELKWFLRTNGEGWTKPMEITYQPEIQLITLENANSSNSCEMLLYYNNNSTNKRDTNMEMNFPMPFFDAKTRPSAIAIPFSHYSLRSIEAPKSADLLIKYFVTVNNCLKTKQATKATYERFHNDFYSFVEHDVLPKLGEDKLYAAFGGILRVEETLRSLGAVQIERKTELPEDVVEAAEDPGDIKPDNSRRAIFWVMIGGVIFWIAIGTCYVCYKIQKMLRKRDKDSKWPKTGASNCGCNNKSKKTCTKLNCPRLAEKKSEQNVSASSSAASSPCKKKCPKSRFGGKCNCNSKLLPLVNKVSEGKHNNPYDKNAAIAHQKSGKSGQVKFQKPEDDIAYWGQSNDATSTASDFTSGLSGTEQSKNAESSGEKPRIFGYDFHTTSSESDDEYDVETKTSSTSK